MRALCWMSMLVLVGCGPQQVVPIGDPPNAPVDFNGTWRVTNLERIDDGPALPTDPGNDAPPFRPIFEGMLLTITGGQLRDGNGALLFEQYRDGAGNERYVNVTGERVLLFDFASSGTAPCTWREELTIQGVGVSDRSISTTVRILSSGDCTDLPPLGSAAVGTFRCALQLAALPATVSPTVSTGR